MYIADRIKKRLSENLSNIIGWRTIRKYVVIESDDWGSVRMPSKKVFDDMLKANIRVDKCPFCSFDSLASEDDLSELFEVLKSVSDMNGNHPVFTANTVVANPDFEKIYNTGFKEYHYEPFTETLKRYPDHKNSLLIWKQGLDAGLFHPQLHGREHLHVNRWMRALSEGSYEINLAFNNNFYGISTNLFSEGKKSFLAAFDADSEEDIIMHATIINEGVRLFNTIFGYYPRTFTAPNYIWPRHLEGYLHKHNINIIQGSKIQLEPDLHTGYIRKRHFTGQKNPNSQIYTVRNCLFEPSLSRSTDWLTACLRQIQTAFFWSKPSIIGTHRVNYIGSIVEENRTNNMILLSQLLRQIVKRWPDVEFISSSDLCNIILKNE